jgi:hypothetical protein
MLRIPKSAVLCIGSQTYISAVNFISCIYQWANQCSIQGDNLDVQSFEMIKASGGLTAETMSECNEFRQCALTLVNSFEQAYDMVMIFIADPRKTKFTSRHFEEIVCIMPDTRQQFAKYDVMMTAIIHNLDDVQILETYREENESHFFSHLAYRLASSACHAAFAKNPMLSVYHENEIDVPKLMTQQTQIKTLAKTMKEWQRLHAPPIYTAELTRYNLVPELIRLVIDYSLPRI